MIYYISLTIGDRLMKLLSPFICPNLQRFRTVSLFLDEDLCYMILPLLLQKDIYMLSVFPEKNCYYSMRRIIEKRLKRCHNVILNYCFEITTAPPSFLSCNDFFPLLSIFTCHISSFCYTKNRLKIGLFDLLL